MLAEHARIPVAESSLSATVKYNPHLWGPDELRDIFVVRTRELNDLLDHLRTSPTDSVPQHMLITGARGMGKSTLLRRIALGVRDDPELATGWIALTFPEEQYTVSTLAEFWSNVLDTLADTLEREGTPVDELIRLDAKIKQLGDLPPAERETTALDLLIQWIDTHQRRVLLLIDGTDLLFASLAGGNAPATRGKSNRFDANATPLWRLRKTLSHQPGILWLGASYQALESQHHYHDAFLDFFQLVELRPLTLDEMRDALRALARTFGAGRELQGEAAVAEIERTIDTRPERLKALRAMTGGNPRTTVMLYDLFAAGGWDDVQTDLRRLLDLMTPLYKARMENLSDQARKLLAHVMEHWAPISARELAEVSGIATGTVSGQLSRLEAEGLIEKTPLPGTKRAGYQATERLFNIWYLMRYASRRLRQRLTWLVEFMRLWYSREELVELARQRAVQEKTEAAYRQAMDLDASNPYPTTNLARLLARMGRSGEANTVYRQAAEQAEALVSPSTGNTDYLDLLLHAHLWLGNRDLARQSLDHLAQAAAEGNSMAFFRLREQTRECHSIGLGPALAVVMEESPYADFLQPFALALRAAAPKDRQALAGAPPEVQTLAEEIIRELLPSESVPGFLQQPDPDGTNVSL